MKYRADIDGLRAVAVVPAILYHAGVSAVSGGFVGVDIFFVISGYLITSLILPEIEAGSFRLSDFYERRARRILPALFVVMLACIPFSWMWLVPIDMIDFSQSVIAASTFSSNMLFWQEADYFQRVAELKPLLHTWSLAVEEQYYILFPLLLMSLWRFGQRKILHVLVWVAVLSLILAQWGANKEPEAAFYFLLTRSWEILAGAFLAFYVHHRGELQISEKHQRRLSMLGLTLLIAAFFWFDRSTRFPGLSALWPVIGTLLVIAFSRPGSMVYQILSSRLMVGIGLISYGAYLWHQPLLAFAKYQLSEPPMWLMLSLSMLSLVLAFVSRRYLEVPFRNPNLVPSKPFRSGMLATFCIFVAAGVVGVADKGNLYRYDDQLLARIEAARSSVNDRVPECRPFSDQPFQVPNSNCWYGNGTKKVLVWGDSHNDSTSRLLPDFLSDVSVYHAGYAWCPPVLGIHPTNLPASQCEEFNKVVLEWAKAQEFDAILLSGRWRIYSAGVKFDNGEGGIEDYLAVFASRTGDESGPGREQGVLEAYRHSIESVAEVFSDIPIFLVYQIPEAGWNVPDLYLRYGARNRNSTVLSTSYPVYLQANMAAKGALDSISAPNIHRIYPEEVFCNTELAGRCVLASGDQIYYRDDDHVTIEGAALLTHRYAEVIAPTLNVVSCSPAGEGVHDGRFCDINNVYGATNPEILDPGAG